jgi:hypothetical protein
VAYVHLLQTEVLKKLDWFWMAIGDGEEPSGSIKGGKFLDQLSLFASEEKLNSMEFYLWLYSPCGPWPLFQFLNPCTVGRTPWTGD